jgi:hypothetical protein
MDEYLELLAREFTLFGITIQYWTIISSRITRSVHSRMDLFKEGMIFRLLSQFLAAPAGTLRGAVGIRHKPTVARSYSPPLESMQCRL